MRKKQPFGNGNERKSDMEALVAFVTGRIERRR
jgi:hypothetical protein